MLPVAYTPIAEKYFKKLKDNQLKKIHKGDCSELSAEGLKSRYVRWTVLH